MTALAPEITTVTPYPAVGLPCVGRGRGTLPLPGLSDLESAIVETITYFDVFDWPLRPADVQRYLPRRGPEVEVEAALAGRRISRFVERHDSFVTLSGRGELVGTRRRREAVSRALWPRAIRWGRVVASLPFVRMVAVTGSLAMDGATEDADVDLLVVTADGRLWLSRAFSMGAVRAAALGGLRLCPNYLLAESDLRIDDRSLFTAHELAQMVPVVESPTYGELLRRNAWYRAFLPNAGGRPALTAQGPDQVPDALRRIATRALRSGLGDLIERWEMERKVRMLARTRGSVETRYDATCCKGHADAHGQRVLAAFHARLRQLEEVA